MKRSKSLLTAGSVLTLTSLLALTACSSGDDEVAAASLDVETAESGSALDLSDVCPATIVMQQDWEPEAEHSGMYSLVGADYTVDADKKRVSGSLVAQGVDTGVEIEVRPGGAAISYQSVSSQMYVDTDIMLGAVTTDAGLASSMDQPVTAVVAQLNMSPQVIMWDPESYPGATTIAEIAEQGASIVVSGGGSNLGSMLSGNGTVPADQIDASYNGDPSRFVGDPTIAQQGFATAEPYVYENEISAWGKPITYQLVSEVGYTVYPEPLTVRTGELEELAPCLTKLVPILQQAQIDYLDAPDFTNDLIVELVETYNTGWVYSKGVADFSHDEMLDLGVIQTDTSGIFGGMDEDRIQGVIDLFGPILEESGTELQEDIVPSDLFTNEFLDTSITFG
ncbi:hypothetical protein [Sanguibacter antarcticus]|uniref:ABC-type nitrate/sulfonate/bicarbonate transport system substrate-binding protein n=1 Tax=Sanguibacter antarcticus TaxID=372484 RepID=A0A2A9E850_9MICO|nr:hypothetical protein [Sanguibacter antarcticus]PFG34409.1 hypothetical protein ATL42_2319 [Sanguibacter antarcticus]